MSHNQHVARFASKMHKALARHVECALIEQDDFDEIEALEIAEQHQEQRERELFA